MSAVDEAGRQAALLEMCGRAAYGDQWQRPLARAIGVDDRLMRRWVAEERPVPDERWGQIKDVLRRRSSAIGVALAAMEGQPVIL